jgi:hypothetical protein
MAGRIEIPFAVLIAREVLVPMLSQPRRLGSSLPGLFTLSPLTLFDSAYVL